MHNANAFLLELARFLGEKNSKIAKWEGLLARIKGSEPHLD